MKIKKPLHGINITFASFLLSTLYPNSLWYLPWSYSKIPSNRFKNSKKETEVDGERNSCQSLCKNSSNSKIQALP